MQLERSAAPVYDAPFAHVVTVHDPFYPQRNRELKTLPGPGPIGAIAPQTDRPFIILRNGEAVLRQDWGAAIEAGDVIVVAMLPQGGGGGGGSNPVRVVLALAVAMYAPQFAAGMLGTETAAIGLSAIGMSSQTFVALATAGIGLAGSVLINAMIPPPKPAGSTASTVAEIQAASPTYNLSGQGNRARLESAIPVQYGRLNVYPDLAAQPYVEYAGNEQYLYQLFCLGVGDYDIEAIRIEDTDISNFEEVTYEIVRPGETLDLFPSSVATSGEVGGQELLQGNPVGAFVANAAGTTATRLAVDVVCSRGLYYAEDNGSLSEKSISFTVEARQINDAGAAVGGWGTVGSHTVSAATTTPQRYSFNYSVTAGRYEVRVTRTDAKDTSTRAGHEIVWSGLRAYLQADQNFGDVTLIAMRLRATNNLSSQASRKVNVTCTRRLYYWTGAAWAGPVASRSVAWALADACRAVGLPDSRIDLAGLVQIDATLAARGDTFNGRFDSTMTFWDALTQIARAGRCRPYMQGGIVCFRRDEAQSVPVALYSMRNIIRGSFSLDFVTPSDDTADAVRVTYFDESAWKYLPLNCALPGSTAAKPAKVDLFGVTNREQAYREGTYMAAANRYRRTLIKFATEMEGFIPSYGDLVAINHDLPQWGQHAEVVAWDAATRTATLSEPMTWGEGTHYIGLRRRDGSVSGPYVVTAGVDAYRVVLATAPDITPYTGQSEERTHITFGWGDTWRQLARVIAIRPRDANTVELSCINEDPSVHTADQGILSPAVNASQLPKTPSAPVVLGLMAKSMPNDPERMLISWQPSPGAEYYVVEQSADGKAWTRTGEPRTNNYTGIALYGSQTIVRVAAVGALQGTWAEINYALEADYMWNANPDTPMWSADENPMWRY